LVTYASRLGATHGVAEAIGKTLAEGGASVDVLPCRLSRTYYPTGRGSWQRHPRGPMAAGGHAVFEE